MTLYRRAFMLLCQFNAYKQKQKNKTKKQKNKTKNKKTKHKTKQNKTKNKQNKTKQNKQPLWFFFQQP